MRAFHGKPQNKTEILRQLKSQPPFSQKLSVAQFQAKKRASISARNSTSKLFELASAQLPDALLRLAADLEMSYLTVDARQNWNHDFIDSITIGADLNDTWRLYSQWRLRNALSSKNLQWLSNQQMKTVEHVANLVEQDVDDLNSWRKALNQTAYAILAIDLADRRRHGLGQTEWHTTASVLQSQVEGMSDDEATPNLTTIASGTAHLAYGIVDPYWKDNMFFVDTHAHKLLELVRTTR